MLMLFNAIDLLYDYFTVIRACLPLPAASALPAQPHAGPFPRLANTLPRCSTLGLGLGPLWVDRRGG